MANLSLGSLVSTSEGWSLTAFYAFIAGIGSQTIPIPDNVKADPYLMAAVIISEVLALALVTAIYINNRGRVKEASARSS